MMLDYLTYAAIALLIIIFLSQAIRILREYERGVVFTLGRFTGVKGPGLAYPSGNTKFVPVLLNASPSFIGRICPVFRRPSCDIGCDIGCDLADPLKRTCK